MGWARVVALPTIVGFPRRVGYLLLANIVHDSGPGVV